MRGVSVLALAVVACGLVAGCSSSGESSAGGPQRQETAASPAEPKSGAGESKQPEITQPGVDRKLVRTVSLDLSTPDVVASADTVRQVVRAEGGFSGQESVSEGRASMTLQVPSDKLDAVVTRLSAEDVGKVMTRGQTAQDVTEQVVDVESRIQTQRASLERVRALLARATEIDEIVRVESEVTRREADLESLLKRQQALVGSTAMSTVTVRLYDDHEAPADDDSFLGALAGGWSALLAALGTVLRVLGLILPFVVVLGVPLVVWLRVRRRRRAAE